MKRFSKIVSVTRALPSAMQLSAMNWACMSVGKAGYSLVRKLTALGRSSARTRIQSSPHRSRTPASRSFSITTARWRASARRSSDIAAGGGHRAQEGAGLDAVGHDLVARTVQPARRPGCGSGAAVAVDARTHRDQHLGQVARPRAPARRSRAPSRRRASVAAISRFSVPVTVTMSVVMRAPRSRCGIGDDVAVLDVDLGAHRLQALDVLVDRPRADRAAARQRDPRLAEARQQRTEHQDRRAHRLDQLVRRLGQRDSARVERAPRRRRSALRSARTPMLRSSFSVVSTSCSRGTFDSVDRLGRQQRGAQFGQRGILGAGDRHLALEPLTAAYQEFVHRDSEPPWMHLRPCERCSCGTAGCRRACSRMSVVLGGGGRGDGSKPTRPESGSSSTARGSARACGRRARW